MEKSNEKTLKFDLITVIPFLGLIFVVVLFAALTKGKSLEMRNLNTVLNQAYTVILLSLGATFIYACGCKDMAYGAVVGFTCMCGILMSRVAFWTILPVVLICGTICYCCTGIIVGLLDLPPFVASMCMKYITLGITTTVTTANGVMAPGQLYAYDNWTLKIIVLVAVFALVYIVFEYTKVGKVAKAIGGNQLTTEQSGHSVGKYRLLCYVIAGIMLGIAAFFNAARAGSVTSNTGTGLEMKVMTAVVLGGLPMSGGARANVRCAIIGSLTIAILTNGMVLIGASTALAQGIQGLVFLATVAISYERPKNYLYD